MSSFTNDGSGRPPSEHPHGEILTPTGEHVAIPDSVEQPRQRRERSGWNPMGSPATYALTALNIGVFVVMVLHQVSPTMPGSDDLVRWGANLGWGEYNGYFGSPQGLAFHGIYRGE